MSQGWLTVEQVAETLQTHPEVVRRWLRSGRLTGVKWGRAWRIPTEAIPPSSSREPAENASPINVFPARVQRLQPSAGLAWLDTGGSPVAVMIPDARRGTILRVLLRGDAILVSRRKLKGISARNQWPGRVETLLVRPGGVEVRVATHPPLVAWMTPEAVRELTLRPGKKVVLIFKAGACRTTPLKASAARKPGVSP